MSAAAVKLPGATWALLVICGIGWAGRFVLPFLTLYMTVYVGLPIATAALVMSMFGLGGVLAVLTAGWLIDRFGAGRVLVASVTTTGIFAALVALAGTRVLLVFVLVLLLGVASQAMAPAFHALVAQVVPPARLRNAYSLVYMSMNLGFMLGPLLGGVLIEISYRLLFLTETALMLVTLCIAIPLLRSKNVRSAIAPPPPAVPESTPSGRVFVVTPPGFRHVFADRAFVWLCVLNIAYMVVYMQPQITLPVVMQESGFSESQYGLLLSLNGALVVVFQLVADRITRGSSEGKLLMLAMLISGVGITGHLFGATIWVHALCVVIWTAGELINMPVATNVAARMAPAGMRGRYMGLFTTSTSLSNFIGPIFGGVALSMFGSTGLWLSCAALTLFVILGRMRNGAAVDARMKEQL